jgi:hypothetical protein
MDTESWNVAEERRVRKLQQIRQLLSIALGPDVDLNQEAKNLIAQWKETAAMEIWPPKASAPLQCLLREYHEIYDVILDIENEKRPSKKWAAFGGPGAQRIATSRSCQSCVIGQGRTTLPASPRRFAGLIHRAERAKWKMTG